MNQPVLFIHDNRMLAERAFYCLCEQRAMKARGVSGTPAGRDAVDKKKGKEMHELISVSLA